MYVGSLSRIRRLEVLIEAVYIACQRLGSGKEFHLDFFGTGDAKKHLIAIAKRLGVHHIISFKGAVPQEALFKILPTYDAGFSYIPTDDFMHRNYFLFQQQIKDLNTLLHNYTIISTFTHRWD